MIRKSSYNKDLVWEDPVSCYICLLKIDLSLSSVVRIGSVLTRSPLSFTEDHYIPLSRGGSNSKKNLRPAHLYCNDSKGVKDFSELDIQSIKANINRFINEGLIVSESNSLKCKFCDTEFYAQSARIVSYNAKFCSKKCLDGSMRTSVKKRCKTCDQEFLVKPSKVKAGKGRYCSVQCYSSSSKERVNMKCSHCDREYFISSSNIRTSVKLFCSSCRKDKKITRTKLSEGAILSGTFVGCNS